MYFIVGLLRQIIIILPAQPAALAAETGACNAAGANLGAAATVQPTKTPSWLQPLLDEGLIDSVQRQLVSGKEAMVCVVRCRGETVRAKVYRAAPEDRIFKRPFSFPVRPQTRHSKRSNLSFAGG